MLPKSILHTYNIILWYIVVPLSTTHYDNNNYWISVVRPKGITLTRCRDSTLFVITIGSGRVGKRWGKGRGQKNAYRFAYAHKHNKNKRTSVQNFLIRVRLYVGPTLRVQHTVGTLQEMPLLSRIRNIYYLYKYTFVLLIWVMRVREFSNKVALRCPLLVNYKNNNNNSGNNNRGEKNNNNKTPRWQMPSGDCCSNRNQYFTAFRVFP